MSSTEQLLKEVTEQLGAVQWLLITASIMKKLRRSEVQEAVTTLRAVANRLEQGFNK